MKLLCSLVLLCTLYCQFDGSSGSMDPLPVKRPRVLPPMFLPTYGKRSPDWIEVSEEGATPYEEEEGRVKKSPDPCCPDPPIFYRGPTTAEESFQRLIRKESKPRPPITLPVMKRGYYVEVEEPREVAYNQYRAWPPLSPPVIKRETSNGPVFFPALIVRPERQRPVDLPYYDDEELSFDQLLKRAPTGLPLVKRRPPGGLPLVRRGPPSGLPLVKRRGVWMAVMPGEEVWSPGNQEVVLERVARGPPSGLPVVKRGPPSGLPLVKRGPPSGLPLVRRGPPSGLPLVKRGPPSGLPLVKRGPPSGLPLVKRGPPSGLPLVRRGPPSGLPLVRRGPPSGLPLVRRGPPSGLPLVKRRQWAALVSDGGDAPPSSFPIMKRNYIGDYYAARQLAENEPYEWADE